jgi:hypothetical protein
MLPIFLNCCASATAKSVAACYIRSAGINNRRKKKRGAMRVRVTTNGRLLGLDIGDWWTLIAGSTLAGLLAFFL